jgi:protein gp37
MSERSTIEWTDATWNPVRGCDEISPGWVYSIRDQCEAQSAPFFFKQWGGPKKSKTGRELHGRTYDECPAKSEATSLPIVVERSEKRDR